VNETACKTNDLPTRVMLSGGSAVSLRDGTSRCDGGGQLLPHCTAKSKLIQFQDALETGALGENNCLEKFEGRFEMKPMFGLNLIKSTNDIPTISEQKTTRPWIVVSVVVKNLHWL